VLTLQGLSKSYGNRVALNDVSFQARPGRILGFLGPNGAGKTTTMRAIFGLVEPDAGTVAWDGRPVAPDDRLRFGYMPEERGLYPKMRIGAQLEYLARLSGMSRSAAVASSRGWLERLGLADRAGDRLEALSHGNQQRVQLAAALVHDPALAVLDEPFSGLDPIGVRSMSSELRRLAADGAVIVFSSHQLDLVEDICDDVVIVDAGSVVTSGTLEQLRSHATRRRLSVTVDGRAWQPDSVPVEAVGEGTRRHLLVDHEVSLASLLAEAESAGDVHEFSFEPPTLTDIFHEAVQR
jgi:ABC-2 type transport system ATP-binding protein